MTPSQLYDMHITQRNESRLISRNVVKRVIKLLADYANMFLTIFTDSQMTTVPIYDANLLLSAFQARMLQLRRLLLGNLDHSLDHSLPLSSLISLSLQNLVLDSVI